MLTQLDFDVDEGSKGGKYTIAEEHGIMGFLPCTNRKVTPMNAHLHSAHEPNASIRYALLTRVHNSWGLFLLSQYISAMDMSP